MEEVDVAIARVFDGSGWTLEQYDELMERLFTRLGAPDRPAPGVLDHWAAATADGVRAVDVYESREAADRLVESDLAPIMQELGLPMPQISEYEVHRHLAAQGPAERTAR